MGDSIVPRCVTIAGKLFLHLPEGIFVSVRHIEVVTALDTGGCVIGLRSRSVKTACDLEQLMSVVVRA